MKGGLRTVLIGAGVLLLGLSLLFAWRVRPENAIVVPPGGEMQYDDFAFSVEGVRRTRVLSDGAARIEASGEFVVVTIGVHNHAKKVDFTFKPETMELVAGMPGEMNSVYRPVTAALPLLAATNGCKGPIPAGSSCPTELAFDLPRGATKLRLQWQYSWLLFDILDTLAYGRMSLALPDK